MAKPAEIRDVLSKLDAGTDEHWTSDGQPKVEVIHQLSGDSTITRKQIIDAAPNFTRTQLSLVVEPPVAPAPSKEKVKRERERMDEIKDAVADLDQQIAERQAQRMRLVAEADDIIGSRPSNHRNSHVGAVKGYLAQQRQNRVKRREKK
jgi:hypothetical protein